MSQVTNNTDDFNGNHTLPPSPATWTGGGGDGDSDEDLQAALHGLDVTVWLMILCIFTFFFIMVAATLCMTWIERRRLGMLRGEVVVVPEGPVPGCLTVSVLPGDPHIRLLAHYHTHFCNKYGTISDAPLITAPRAVSAPDLHNSCCSSSGSGKGKK